MPTGDGGSSSDATAVPVVGSTRAGRPFRFREVLEGVPRTVWFITVAFACLCVCYAFLVPVYRAPDEPAHLDLVYGLRTGDEFPRPAERAFAPEVRGSVAWLAFDETRPRLHPAAEARPRDERPSFDEVDPVADGRINPATSHPPLYYSLEAALLWLTPGALDWNFDQVVVWLRLTNAVLLVPLPLLVFAVARRLSRSRAAAVAAAAFPLAVPQLLHVSASVNNDNLLNVLAALLTLVGLAIAQGDLSRRTAVAAGAVLGLALLTKGFALVLVGWLGLAYLLGWARRRGGLPWGPGLLALAVAVGVGGWWWIRNVLLYGVVQPSGAAPPAPLEGPRAPASEYWIDMFSRWLVERLWGSFGYVDTPIPWPVAAAGVVVVVVGMLLAFVLPARVGQRRTDMLLAPGPAVLALGLIVVAGWSYYSTTGIAAGIQGRYLYGGIAGVAAVMAIGYATLLRGLDRALPLAVLVGAVGMHLVAVETVLERYWGAALDGAVVDKLRAVIAWSPWDGIWLVMLWAVAAGAGAVLGLSMLADALWPTGRDDDGSSSDGRTAPRRAAVGGAHRGP